MPNGGNNSAGGSNETKNSDAVAIRLPKALILNDDCMEKSWKKWIQQFDWWATATDFADKSANKQVATFMSALGPEKQSLPTVKEKFTNYFTPTTRTTFQRFLFNSMNQHQDEKALEFIARIKLQAEKCEFGALKNELVRDRIVIGINNLELQKRLLAEDNLDLPRAEAQCRLSEITDAQFKNMNQSETIVIDAVQKGRRDRDSNDRGGKEHDRSGKEYDCKRCGTRHVFRNCPSFKKKCGNCNRLGHITELCRARKKVDTVLNENIDIEDSETQNISENQPQKFTSRQHQLAYQLVSTCPSLIRIQRKQILMSRSEETTKKRATTSLKEEVPVTQLNGTSPTPLRQDLDALSNQSSVWTCELNIRKKM
jgi:hypothetical protein